MHQLRCTKVVYKPSYPASPSSSLQEFPPWHSMLLHQSAPHINRCGKVQLSPTDVSVSWAFLLTGLASFFLSRFLYLCHPNAGTAAPKSSGAEGVPALEGPIQVPHQASPLELTAKPWQIFVSAARVRHYRKERWSCSTGAGGGEREGECFLIPLLAEQNKTSVL